MDNRIWKYGYNSFDGWPQEEIDSYLAECRIMQPRKLPDGSWAGLQRLAYTLSVCVGVTPLDPFAYRWCFEDRAEAVKFLNEAEHLKSVPTSTESLVGHRHLGKGALLMKFEPGTGFPRWDY